MPSIMAVCACITDILNDLRLDSYPTRQQVSSCGLKSLESGLFFVFFPLSVSLTKRIRRADN
jgi:hypothetical protein